MKKAINSWIIFTFTLAFISDNDAHKIEDLVVPAIADPRENAVLSCKYNMGEDQLYSAKWHKDDQEIYRYMPTQKPPGLTFPVSGVQIARPPRCSEIACDLELTDLTPSSAGVYRCEVSKEGPTFKIVQESANMTVAALLRRDPLVEGAATSYGLGDEIRVNCTSDPSLPPAEVTWYINDNEAPFPFLEGASESAPDSRGLSTRSLGLRLRAERSLFLPRNGVGGSTGSLRLRCVSAMPSWLPGGPHRRQFTITASLRSPPQTNNQKLKWLSGGGVTTSGCPMTLLMFAILTFLAAIRRRPQEVY